MFLLQHTAYIVWVEILASLVLGNTQHRRMPFCCVEASSAVQFGTRDLLRQPGAGGRMMVDESSRILLRRLPSVPSPS